MRARVFVVTFIVPIFFFFQLLFGFFRLILVFFLFLSVYVHLFKRFYSIFYIENVCANKRANERASCIRFKKSLYVRHINMSNVICAARHIWEVKLVIAFLEKWNIDKVDEPAHKPTHQTMSVLFDYFEFSAHIHNKCIHTIMRWFVFFPSVWRKCVEWERDSTSKTPTDDSVILHLDFMMAIFLFPILSVCNTTEMIFDVNFCH